MPDQYSNNPVPTVNVTEAYQLLSNNKNILLIDVREPAEWDECHIPGALHIPKGIIQQEIEKHAPNKSNQLILHCRGGTRSLNSALTLLNMGYENVSSMTGGIMAWLEAGYPVVED